MDGLDQRTLADPKKVLVFHGDENEGVQQPSSFKVSSNGLQIYNRREVPLFTVMEFTLEFPALREAGEQYYCTGIVAQCQFDDSAGLYKLIVTFLEVPDPAHKRIEALTHPAGSRALYGDS